MESASVWKLCNRNDITDCEIINNETEGLHGFTVHALDSTCYMCST